MGGRARQPSWRSVVAALWKISAMVCSAIRRSGDPAIGLQRVEQVAEMDAVGPQSTCC
jgi:hypothetical protein